VVGIGLDIFPNVDDRLSGTVDIWWERADGGIMILLAQQLRRNKTWARCKLRLFVVAYEHDDNVELKEQVCVCVCVCVLACVYVSVCPCLCISTCVHTYMYPH
jgi:hypothetical protein